jgi:hypothetical protein
MISSDGHVTARMQDWRAYMPSKHHEEFDVFLAVYREKGSWNNEPAAMIKWFDPDVVKLWEENVIDENRLVGTWDIKARFEEMAR